MIRNRYDDSLIFNGTIEEAIKNNVSLSGAYLIGANLKGADLTGAYLIGANLTRADLSEANLTRANLTRASLAEAYLVGADLTRANLVGAYLTGANLVGANLVGAYLARANLVGANFTEAYLARANFTGADLTMANLTDIIVNWQSRELIVELLKREAQDDIEKLKVVGYISLCSLCWNELVKIDDPLKDWCLHTLKKYVRDGDHAPSILIH